MRLKLKHLILYLTGLCLGFSAIILIGAILTNTKAQTVISTPSNAHLQIPAQNKRIEGGMNVINAVKKEQE